MSDAKIDAHFRILREIFHILVDSIRYYSDDWPRNLAEGFLPGSCHVAQDIDSKGHSFRSKNHGGHFFFSFFFSFLPHQCLILLQLRGCHISPLRISSKCSWTWDSVETVLSSFLFNFQLFYELSIFENLSEIALTCLNLVTRLAIHLLLLLFFKFLTMQ